MKKWIETRAEHRRLERHKALMAWADEIEKRALKKEENKMNFLPGKKTYICAIGLVIVAGLHALGYMNDMAYQTAYGILTGGGLASLRAAK